MIETEAIESILRPLAERTMVPCNCPTDAGAAKTHEACGHTMEMPDPRFNALRCQHDWQDVAHGGWPDGYCRRCGMTDKEYGRRNAWIDHSCLDISLGAIVRAAAACGLSLRLSQRHDGDWFCVSRDVERPWIEDSYLAISPELAATKALVAFVYPPGRVEAL